MSKIVVGSESKETTCNNGVEKYKNGGIYKETTEKIEEDPEFLDGGFGWVVVSTSFLIFALLPGLMRSYGVFHLHIRSEFYRTSEAKSNMIPSLLTTFTIGAAPLSSVLCSKISIKRTVLLGGLLSSTGLMLSFFANGIAMLCVTYGCIFGIGISFCTTPAILLVARYFKRRRALANGLCLAGTSAGSIAMPPIVEFLCEEYTYKGTMLILGALTLNICAMSCVFKLPEEVRTCTTVKLLPKEDSPKKKFVLDLSYLKNPVFLVLAISACFYRFAIPQVLFYFPAHATILGFNAVDASYLLSISAVCDMVGRMGFGLISDRKFFRRIDEFSITIMLCATGMFILKFMDSYVGLVVAVAIFGLGAGSSIILLPVLLTDHHGPENMPSTLAILKVFQAVTTLSAPPITGLIKDLTGDYDSAFLLMGAMLVSAAITIQFTPFAERCMKSKEQEGEFVNNNCV